MRIASAFAIILPLLSCSPPSFSDHMVDTQPLPTPKIEKSCQTSPYPVVLVHGMGGFDKLNGLDYFFGVSEDLRQQGVQVYTAELSPYQSTTVRGRELAQRIDQVLAESKACKLNLIAHSQGGLDARYAIGSLGYGDRIASVVSISTPHRGSAVADVALGLAPGLADPLFNAIASFFGTAVDNPRDNTNLRACLQSLTEANAKTFAAQNPDDPRVAFFSVAGRSLGLRADSECSGSLWPNPDAIDLLEPALLPTGLLLQGNPFTPQANDGLVTVASAKWGTFLGCIPADHADEVGQIADVVPDLSSGWNHKDFYRKLVRFLRDKGL
jgi:triacylglycerol lipase